VGFFPEKIDGNQAGRAALYFLDLCIENAGYGAGTKGKHRPRYERK
jgi:hypothetical protein